MCLCNLVPKGKGENSQQRFLQLHVGGTGLVPTMMTNRANTIFLQQVPMVNGVGIGVQYSVTKGSVNKLEWYNQVSFQHLGVYAQHQQRRLQLQL